MEIITSNYQQFKQALDAEIRREAEGFVKIGYLLRVARDTDVLNGSGYSNVNDFAKKEYGLDTSQVSRFISINERFSEGGYSDRLEAHYEGFGVAKLSIMLQLPDNLNEELTPEFSKSEIDTLRREVKEESDKTDIEIMMETQATDEIDEAIKETLRNPDSYRKTKKLTEEGRASDEYIKLLKEILAPSGVSIKAVRVSGVGRIMVKFDETNEVKFVKVRQNETVTKPIAYVAVVINEYARQEYKDLFGEELPEEKKEPVTPSKINEKRESGVADLSKIAPVQQKKEAPKKEPKKEPKVTPAPIPKVKPEEAEILPPPEPAKLEVYSVKKPSQIIREDIAESIEYLHKNIESIKTDFMSYRIEQQLKVMLDKVARLIEAENEEANDVGED